MSLITRLKNAFQAWTAKPAQLPYKPDPGVTGWLGTSGETVIRWSQRTAYLFIESDENGALVHTNLPDVTCPRCHEVVTDAGIVDRPQEYANHTCGSRRGAR